jgi:hypothetical protein
MKNKMCGAMQFANEAFDKLTCAMFRAKPDSTGGDDIPQDSASSDPQAEHQPKWKKSKAENIHAQRPDGKVYVTGSRADSPDPKLRYCVGQPIGGDYGNVENWDFIVGKKVETIKLYDSIRSCDLQLDRAARTKLTDFTRTLNAPGPSNPTEKKESITR